MRAPTHAHAAALRALAHAAASSALRALVHTSAAATSAGKPRVQRSNPSRALETTSAYRPGRWYRTGLSGILGRCE